jgi:hypothetical protein
MCCGSKAPKTFFKLCQLLKSKGAIDPAFTTCNDTKKKLQSTAGGKVVCQTSKNACDFDGQLNSMTGLEADK